MFFQRLKTPGLGHNSSVLACGDGLAVVIDPRRDVYDYLRLARETDLSIAYVLETHRQEDFEFGSSTLAQMTGARIVSGSHALFGETDVKLEDDEELKVGTTRFVALETPGHTPESMSYAVYVKDAGDKCWGVFTGDALFVCDTGLPRFDDPENRQPRPHHAAGFAGDASRCFPCGVRPAARPGPVRLGAAGALMCRTPRNRHVAAVWSRRQSRAAAR